MIQQKIIWNDAARSGLVLGGVSIGYMLCTILLGKLQGGPAIGVIVNVLSLLLWVFKFVLCIRLMKFFMLKFAASNPEAANGDTFRFGTATALLSALIYSAFYLAWVSFINPDMFTSSIDMVREAYSGTFTSDQMDAIDEMVPKLPTITFFVNLVWCWLFGTVLSAIFSANIPPRNPFRDVPKDI
jgi:hypothetical protein